MAESTFKLYGNHALLTDQVDAAISLSNTRHGATMYDLADTFAQILNIARTAWNNILAEIGEIIIEIPQKAYVAAQWIVEYKRISVRIADAIALMICAQYAKGRAILEAEYNPLQNIRAQISNSLYEYEHVA